MTRSEAGAWWPVALIVFIVNGAGLELIWLGTEIPLSGWRNVALISAVASLALSIRLMVIAWRRS